MEHLFKTGYQKNEKAILKFSFKILIFLLANLEFKIDNMQLGNFFLAKDDFVILLTKIKVGPPITGFLTLSTKVIPNILSNLTLVLSFFS